MQWLDEFILSKRWGFAHKFLWYWGGWGEGYHKNQGNSHSNIQSFLHNSDFFSWLIEMHKIYFQDLGFRFPQI